MEKKYCIVHIPNYIDPNGRSGSNIRPRKMVEAFESCGYHVDWVQGYGEERKKIIKKIKKRIRDGVNYEFMYCENSTMPTLLTEKNHFPSHPFLDFSFMHFCKKHGIRIGLFYRDVYWKFPVYKSEVSFIKRCISIPLYHYDLKKYGKLLDMLYLPSMKMRPYVNVSERCSALPPGCEIVERSDPGGEKNTSVLNLFYVGGIGQIYDLTELLKCVRKLEFIRLTICCREEEWEVRKEYYKKYLAENITIIHKSGSDLRPYYESADICLLFFSAAGYRSFAMPIKLFEYLSYRKPVIATKGSAAGEFVEQNQIGWNIVHDETVLEELLRKIINNRKMLDEVNDRMETAFRRNVWQARAEQVIQDLKY